MFQTAVVLKAYSQNRFLVFDQSQGMHTIIVPSSCNGGVHCGRLIRHESHQRMGTWYVQHIIYSAFPACWAKSDIWFLHHVIDLLRSMLCYYQPEPEVFQLVYQLYRPVDGSVEQARFMLLARLFFLLGVQPEGMDGTRDIMYAIAQYSFHDLLRYAHHTHRQITRWVALCAATCNKYVSLVTEDFYRMRGL